MKRWTLREDEPDKMAGDERNQHEQGQMLG